MKKISVIALTITMVACFVFGFIGYDVLEGLAFSDAMYLTIQQFGLNIDPQSPNIYAEISRWLAVLATANVLYAIIIAFSRKFRNYILSKKASSCVVFGDSEQAVKIAENLGGIHQENYEGIVGKNNIIAFSNEENSLEFYVNNINALTGTSVHLMSDRLEGAIVGNDNLHIVDMAKITARSFWGKENLVKLFNVVNAKGKVKLGIYGFDKIGQDILIFGLQKNLFSLNQCIEYHIWGNTKEFESIHTELDKIELDKIIFHEESFFCCKDIGESLDFLILCDTPAQNMLCLAKLAKLVLSCEIMAYIPDTPVISLDIGPVSTFGFDDALLSHENLLEESMLENAKLIHLDYQTNYGGKTWEELSHFLKYSNISSADFWDTTQIIKEARVKMSNEALYEEIAELEHIRWCRYYYINNWRYGARDNSKKLHNCLVPYKELSQQEKLKDHEKIHMLEKLFGDKK